MKTVFRLLFVIVASMPVLAQAQSGIGLPPFDADVAFHIKTGSFDHGLRVDGLVDDPTDLLTDVIVKDANGVLFYRPITDLTVSGKWIDRVIGGRNMIVASQANDAGNIVSVLDNGRLGIGTSDPRAGLEINGQNLLMTGGGDIGIGTIAPRNSLDIVDGGLVIERSGVNVSGTPNTNESIRLAGGSGDAVFTTSNGDDFNIKYNADFNDQFTQVNQTAVKLSFNGDPRTEALNGQDGDAFSIFTTQSNGAVGAGISWRRTFVMENSGEIGINNTNPQTLFHVGNPLVGGTSSVRLERNGVPRGTINNVPATDPEVLLIDNNGDVQRIQPFQLFNDEGEWVDAGDYIYARKPFVETSSRVVISEEGRFGIGMTNPQEAIHIASTGGIRLNAQSQNTQAISFNETTNPTEDPTNDGARLYLDRTAFGGTWNDAFVFEKTDFNGNAVDGGFAFANRQAGNNRTITMVIRGDGEVGIGNNFYNPTERLHVIGSGLFANAAGTAANEGMVKLVDDDDNDRPSWAQRGLQVSDDNQYAYFGLEDNNTGDDAVIMWGDDNNRDLHFIHDNSNTQTEVMMLDGATKRVGIGPNAVPAPSATLDVDGNARVRNMPPLGTYDETNNRIVVTDANGNLQTVTSAVFAQDFEDLDWTVLGNGEMHNANSGPIGIGLINPENSSALHINGNLRMENSSAIQLDDADVRIFAPNDGALDIEASSVTTFQHSSAAGIDPLVVEHNTGRIQIGIGRAGNQLSATVDGVLRMQDDSEVQFGSNSNNMIYAHSANDFRQTANQLWSVRNRGDGIGILSVRTDQRRVGINRNNPEDALDIDGRLRIRDVAAVTNYDQFLVIDPTTGQVRRRELDNFVGPWERNISGAEGRTVLVDVNDVVGIGLTDPDTDVKLHIEEQNGTVAQADRGTIMLDHEDAGGSSSIVFRSRANRNSDYGYINYYDDNPELTSGNAEQSLLEIGVENDASSVNRDDLALMPSGEVGIKTRTPTRDLDVNGDLRVRTITDSPTDIYALTTDVDGNVNRQDISAIRDNLGNHIMTDTLRTEGNVIGYGTGIGGMQITPQNSIMTSARLQFGHLRNTWIDDQIGDPSVVRQGFPGNDAAIFAPVYTGSETSDLRLYIVDNWNDAFSIWGNPCNTLDCGEINNSSRIIQFRGDGEIFVERLRTGGGPDQMVVVDANGRLHLGGVPGTTSSGTGDNLGNHIAVQNLILGNNEMRTASGMRIQGDDGFIFFPNQVGVRWGGNGITGNTQANGEGGDSDMRFETSDDFYFQTTGTGGDFIVDARNDIDLEADDNIDLRAGTDNTNDNINFYTDNNTLRLQVRNQGEIRVPGLGGGGNQVVGVDNDGDLFALSTSSDGLWDRDAANEETFLFNLADDVGIGTANPDAALHVYRNSNSVEAELRLQNQNGGGDSRIRFMEGTNPVTNNGFSFRFDGGQNDLFLERNDGRQYMTFEDGNGNVGVGAENPQVMLHVMRRAGSVATGGSDAQSGYNNPARLRISNEAGNGSSALEFSEGQAGLGNNNGMSLRYQGDLDEFHVVRGPSEDQNLNDIHLRIARNSGQTTIRHLGTTVLPGGTEMVVANEDGVLSTRAFDDDMWGKDDTDSEVFLDPVIAGYQVGLGTATPQRKLHVAGDVRIDNFGTGDLTDNVVSVDANGDLRTLPMSNFENYWTRDGSGNLFPATSADNVGIGESSPSAKLHVDGDAIVTDMVLGNAGVDELVVVDANGLLKKIPGNSYDSFWSRNTSGAQAYTELTASTDFVGIGTTTTPAAQLHTTGTIRFESLANPDDEVIMVDAAGNLSTIPLPTELWGRDATNGYTYTAFGSDDVGIGTNAPTSRLHVATGQVTITDIVSNTGSASDRVVVADGAGELHTVDAGFYESQWTYETATNRLYPNQLGARTGIGTNEPSAVLHVSEDVPLGSGDMEVRLENIRGNGNVNLRFRTGRSSNGFNDENNSMILRYTNQYDAMEITNGYGAADPNYSSHFKVRRNNGFVGINVGTAVPSDQLEVGAGNVRISNGNLEFGQRRRIQWDDANSFIGDNGDLANQDLYISAAEDMIIRGQNRVLLRAQGANGDFDVDATRNILMDANEGIRINARGADLDLRAGNNSATDDIIFRAGGGTYGIMYGDGRMYLYGGGTDPDKLDVDGQVRLRDLSAGPNPGMVVADNNGRLSKQAIPTFTDTDDQGLLFSGGIISIEDGTGSIDLAPYFDNTDAQDLAYDPATGVFSLTNDGTTVDLSNSAIIDDQDLELTGSILSLTNDASTVDLSAFANTDAQAISLVGDELRITGNASVVDLAAYANTDAQALSYDAATGVLTLANGGPAINLSASTIIDDQTLSLSGTELTIANGNMVDLAPIGVLSSGWSRSGTDVTLGGGATSVGIGTSPASGVALHVTGVARFDGLTGTGLGFVMADASGNLTRRVIPSVTGWNYTGGTNMSLANASQNLMVGIGTATAKLHVDGSTLLDGTLEVSEAATFNNDVNIDLSTTGTKMTITGNGTDDPLQLINVQAAGSAPHNVLVLDASGNVQVVNGVTASDRRLKENIKPMEGTLEKLLGMESVTFNYRKDVKDYPYSLDEETHYGVIAQQVQAAFPHAVVEKDGYLHIQEKELMGVVISATKELSAKNAELEAANEHLAEQLHHMMMDKADLEKTVHSLEAQTSELQTSMDQVLQHIANGKQVQAGGN